MATLTIHDCVLAVSLETGEVIVPVVLTIHDCVFAVTEGNITLFTADSLTIHDCVLAVSIDNAKVAAPKTLTIHDCVLAVEAGSIIITGIPMPEVSAYLGYGGIWCRNKTIKVKIGNEWKETEPTFIS